MPSGSHGGRRGGHSFGGSRIGSSKGIKFGSFQRRDNDYHRYRYPLKKKKKKKKTSGYNSGPKIGPLISFLVFGLVICSVFFFTQLSKINQIKRDQSYYFNMIETAEPNQYVTAKVTNQFLGEGGKYYITYNIEDSNFDLWYEDGYTYSIYTVEEASRIFRRGEIQIVVDRLPLTSDTDSINADYMNFDLSDDGSYVEAVRLSRIALGIGLILIFSIILSLTYYFKTSSSQRSSLDQYTNDDTQEKKDYCLYCGSVIAKDKTKCPNCGAIRSYSR